MSANFPTRPSLTRRGALQLFGLGAAATALGGCMPTSGGASPQGSAGLSGAGPTDFKFASWSLTEAAAAPALEQIIDGYEAKQGVKVAPTSFPYNEYINQLTLQIKGGQFTGAAHVDVAWLGSLAAMGKLQDLSSLAEGRGYTDAALAAARFDGVQYALPWTIGAIGLVSNAEMLQKVGVAPDGFPTTIDGFEKTLKDLKALGGGIIPYAASTKAAQLKDVLIWMQTFGSPLVDGDTVTIGDDASVEAVTWYKSLYDQGLISPDVDRFDARSLFSQGRAAIYDDAPVGRNAVTKESPDANLASKLNPVARPVLKQGDKPRALVWGGAIAVVDGDGAATAGDFAQFATSDLDTVLGDYAVRGLPPATAEALESDKVASDAFGSLFSERITATATTNPLWAFTSYSQVESEIANRVQAVLVGSAKPADAMKAAGEAAQKLVR
ncbi:extracellular solute-binding protein [Pseudarthrobacter sp. SL88]|uniref:ABC transporter substrate-binding protein n=1 Tax=Micrococcaceae TaxID=1268 RepID=UPI000ADB1BBE|nr:MULTISPECIES: extracellular solute-binding protein [Micrococcaceae]MCY1673358.1 extracellular solute-binding protein [Pseudarthrobacter sp. SL88]MDQ1054445.1 multiple sugar transport system substrate-binding protein [Arthrobacter sp. SORGH_AS_0212]